MFNGISLYLFITYCPFVCLFVFYHKKGKLVKQQRLNYFRNKWNLLELSIIFLSWSAVAIFIKRTLIGNRDLTYYQNHQEQWDQNQHLTGLRLLATNCERESPTCLETFARDSLAGILRMFKNLVAKQTFLKIRSAMGIRNPSWTPKFSFPKPESARNVTTLAEFGDLWNRLISTKQNKYMNDMTETL